MNLTPKALWDYAHDSLHGRSSELDKNKQQNGFVLASLIVKTIGFPIHTRDVHEYIDGKPFYPLQEGFKLEIKWYFGKAELWLTHSCEICESAAFIRPVYSLHDIGLANDSMKAYIRNFGGVYCSTHEQ